MDGSMSLDEARSRALALAETVRSVEQSLASCDDRVLAESVSAPADSPGHDSSAMDGYAVRHADLGVVPRVLEVVTTSSAGHPSGRALGAGEAGRILTGAVMVPGADTVVRVEDTDGGLDRVEVRRRPPVGTDVRRRGEVARAGDVVLSVGTHLNPAHLGLAAGVGRTMLRVVDRPGVAVVSTGDELVRGGARPGPGRIHESNAVVVASMARRSGCDATEHHCGDDPTELRRLLARLADSHDLVLTTGGVSMGAEFDVVRDAVAGWEVDVIRVAIAPGKPLALGVVGATPMVGLPGNPVAAVVSFELFVRPMLRRLRGLAPSAGARTGIAGAAMARRDDGRTRLVRVRRDVDGRWVPTSRGGTHVLSGVAEASALAVLAPGPVDVEVGEAVELVELWG